MDDTLALLLALASDPEEVEIMMISVTYGNVAVMKCLKNVVSLFYVLGQELEWRKTKGIHTDNFGVFKRYKPIVAVGPAHALDSEVLKKDGFRQFEP